MKLQNSNRLADVTWNRKRWERIINNRLVIDLSVITWRMYGSDSNWVALFTRVYTVQNMGLYDH